MKANLQILDFFFLICVLLLHWALGWMEEVVGGPLSLGHCECSSSSVSPINVLEWAGVADSLQKPLNHWGPVLLQSSLL